MFDYLKNENKEIEFICTCCGQRTARRRFYDIVLSGKMCVACAQYNKNVRYGRKKAVAVGV